MAKNVPQLWLESDRDSDSLRYCLMKNRDEVFNPRYYHLSDIMFVE